MARAGRNVLIGGRWYGPSYSDAGPPPRQALPAGSGGGASARAVPDLSAGSGEPPPKSGPGSGDAAWTEYALRKGVEVTESMKRGDIIAACQAAGVPTE